MGVPSLVQKQHADEHRIKAFVSFLFLCIVLLVAFSHVYFNQQLAQHSYFDSVRFLKENRSVHISDEHGGTQLKAWLGIPLPENSKSYKCRPRDLTNNETDAVCFEWIDQARLQVTVQETEHLRCYEIHWQSLSSSFAPLDCFDASESVWFGGGLTTEGMKWPLNKLNIPLSPFVTGQGNDVKWGSILKRRFFSSTGAAIVVDENVPLWLEFKDDKLCVESRSGYPYNTESLPVLNYSICTGPDAPTTIRLLADNGLWDGVRKDEMEVIRELLQDPVWRFDLISASGNLVESLRNFTNRILSVEWTSPGYLMLTRPWEAFVGDLEFDTSQFDDLEAAFEIIHRKGFKIAVGTSPYFSTFSQSYEEGLIESNRSFWLSQPPRDDGPLVPSLVSKDDDNSLVVLDPTYLPAAKWFSKKLSNLKKKYTVDAVVLDLGTTESLPKHFQLEVDTVDPSKLTTYFLKAVRSTLPTVLATSSAIEMPKLPTFVITPKAAPTWDGLQTTLPSVLTLSILGYPFIICPPVGGNVSPGESTASKELYIRWLEFNTFLPVIQYKILPFDYDDETMEIAEKLATLRKTLVMPIIRKIADESVLSAAPIIRPIWFLDSEDPECFSDETNDQFLIGDKILVAPILTPETFERDIYLPRGVWKDGMDGSLRKGGRWLNGYKVNLRQIPYFIRMPDGTRL
ncbi:myogenesis-regulating glycosidase-like [Artemia franciscana]